VTLPGTQPPFIQVIAVLPYIELLVFGILILLVSALSRGRNLRLVQLLTFAGLASAAYSSLSLWGQGRLQFDQSHMVVMDNTSVYVLTLLCIGGLLTALTATNFVTRQEKLRGEFYALILFCIIGMGVLASTLDLIVLFLAVELLSIGLYVLAGFDREKLFSNEAALKYFILGSFSSAFLLLGIALLFGASNGTTDIAQMLSAQPSPYLSLESFTVNTWPLSTVGWSLVLVGMAFKMALVPFHVWTPDVYQGAPTPVTAFMSVGVKAAALTALLRIMVATDLFAIEKWSTMLATLAILTMTVGNVIAIAQNSLKRMLAYSSIAHAGYLVLGVVAGGDPGMVSKYMGYQAILFYLAAYTFMNLGAFAFVIYAGADGDLSLDRCKGLGFRHPIPAAAMAIFMLSLAGIPPTMGFLAKIYLFQSVVAAGDTGLAVIAVLNSVVAVYYYLRVVVMMYMHESPEEKTVTDKSRGLLLAVCGCALVTLLLGIFPAAVIKIVQMCS